MNQTTKQLGETYKQAKQEAETALKRIIKIQNECQHDWDKIQYVPIVIPAYITPGDPPGTMGIDWRGPCYVSGSTTPKWKRVCKLCGLIHTTRQTTKKQQPGFIPGTYSEGTVPDFDNKHFVEVQHLEGEPVDRTIY